MLAQREGFSWLSFTSIETRFSFGKIDSRVGSEWNVLLFFFFLFCWVEVAIFSFCSVTEMVKRKNLKRGRNVPIEKDLWKKAAQECFNNTFCHFLSIYFLSLNLLHFQFFTPSNNPIFLIASTGMPENDGTWSLCCWFDAWDYQFNKRGSRKNSRWFKRYFLKVVSKETVEWNNTICAAFRKFRSFEFKFWNG